MNAPTFIFQGRVYHVVEGEIITVDYDPAFGDWIRMTAADYEFVANKISENKDKMTYRIDTVKYFTEDNLVPIFDEEPQSKVPDVDLSKLKKADLLEIAQDIGFDVSMKLTKKDLIEMIEGIGAN